MRAAGVVATMQGFPPLGGDGEDPAWMGTGLAQGQGAEGLAQVRQGSPPRRRPGSAVRPYMCTLLADVAAHLGHPADGLQALTEAHTLVEHHEERWWKRKSLAPGCGALRQPEPAQAEAEAQGSAPWRLPDARRRNR